MNQIKIDVEKRYFKQRMSVIIFYWLALFWLWLRCVLIVATVCGNDSRRTFLHLSYIKLYYWAKLSWLLPKLNSHETPAALTSLQRAAIYSRPKTRLQQLSAPRTPRHVSVSGMRGALWAVVQRWRSILSIGMTAVIYIIRLILWIHFGKVSLYY